MTSIGPTQPRERFIAGDSLRAAAAIGVLVGHAGLLAATTGGNEHEIAADPFGGVASAYGTMGASVMYAGGIGVWVFLFLAGYLIGGPVARSIVYGTPAQPVSTYASNRVLRIVPAYWTVLTILVIFVVLLQEARPTTSDVVSMFVFHVTPENPLSAWMGQAWTLEVETKFYALVGIAAIVVVPWMRRIGGSPKRRALTVAVLCFGWFAIAPFTSSEPGEHALTYNLGPMLGGVAIGALEPLIRSRVGRRMGWARIAAAMTTIGFAYILSALALATRVGGPFDSSTGQLMTYVAVGSIVTGLLLAQWATGNCWRMLDNRPMTWLGARSYSLYLVHLPILWALLAALRGLDYGHWATFALLLVPGLAISTIASALLFSLVEQPFLRRKRTTIIEPASSP